MTQHPPNPPLTVEQVIARLQAIANSASYEPRAEYWYLHTNAGRSVITRRVDVAAMRRKREGREGA